MSYQTTQRVQLYHFLKQHPHSYFTVKQLAQALAETGADISISAIYRNLSQLSKNGSIKKTVSKDHREVFYRYTDSSMCRNEIHAVCTVCGKLFHLRHSLSEHLQQQLILQNDFLLDKSKTIISGICKECQAAPQNQPAYLP